MTFISTLVPRTLLLHKLGASELSAGYVNWHRSCITNRQYQVRVSEILSWRFEVHSNAPEGCIPGNLLFDMLINGLCFATAYSTNLRVADVIKIFHAIKSVED
jgi:hypothetical protein